MLGFEEAMKKENKDLGKADNQVQLLCMLVGNESDANLPGPSHAISASYKGDTGAELLSWILGFYDAFRVSPVQAQTLSDYVYPDRSCVFSSHSYDSYMADRIVCYMTLGIHSVHTLHNQPGQREEHYISIHH